jgi:hypothetical protein
MSGGMFSTMTVCSATAENTGAAVSELQMDMLGLFNQIYTMNLGSSTGPQPMKDTLVCVAS